jgi:hypothetical protein
LNFLISSLYGCYTPLSLFFQCGEKEELRVGGESNISKRTNMGAGRPPSLSHTHTHTHYNNGAAAGGILARLNVLMVTQSEPQ